MRPASPRTLSAGGSAELFIESSSNRSLAILEYLSTGYLIEAVNVGVVLFILMRRGATVGDLQFRWPSRRWIAIAAAAGVLVRLGVVINDVQLGTPLIHGRILESLALFVLLVGAAPIAEEMLFRGLVYQGLRARVRGSVAALLSAVAFAGYHLSIGRAVQPLVVGLLLAWVFERSRSLWACIALHAVANMIIMWYYLAV